MSEALPAFLTPPASPQSARIVFSGNGSSFLKMLVRGGLLELITVGFYRFWLATDMRRHLWSHTGTKGDAAEYTGTGKELLIGFFFAMAILAPVYVLYFLASLEVERIQALASIPLASFLYVFGQFAMYRARRYRLTRTIWRGVRFWMTGSGWAYAWHATLWGALVVVTLGVMLPWRTAALERYKMGHTHYGDLQASFEGTGGDLFKRGWWLWLLALLSGWLLIPMLFIYPAYKATEWKWFLSGVRFGDVRFESDMTRGGLMGAYWKAIGWAALLCVVFVVIFGIASQLVFGSGGAGFSERFLREHLVVVAAVFAVPYLLFLLSLNVIVRFYLVRGLWRRVADTVTVQNLHVVDNVVAKGDLVNALGEGLGGSMDIVGF